MIEANDNDDRHPARAVARELQRAFRRARASSEDDPLNLAREERDLFVATAEEE